jgi:hypothetical protein
MRSALLVIMMLSACVQPLDFERTRGWLNIVDGTPDYMADAWLDGADAWNHAIGYAVIDDAPGQADFEIRAMVGDELVGSDWDGTEQLITPKRADVHMRPGYGADRSLAIATHELGHACGLSHSANPASVMYEDILHTDPDAEHPHGGYFQHITDDDIARMRVALRIDERERLAGVQSKSQALVEPCSFGSDE